MIIERQSSILINETLQYSYAVMIIQSDSEETNSEETNDTYK